MNAKVRICKIELLSCYFFMFVAPLSTSSTPCSLLLPPGGPVVSLQWSTSFTSQHAVERYRVVVTPDPSSCSSQQVSPSENYTCSGLVLGTEYSFTVSAINCGNQEGTRETFTIQPQGNIFINVCNSGLQLKNGTGSSRTVQFKICTTSF